MSPVLLHRAPTPAEAWLVKHALAQEGIAAEVRGENLSTLAGAIPVRDAQPTVWVAASDRDAAERVLARLQGPELVHPEWTCPHCGETNPPSFAVCWKCER